MDNEGNLMAKLTIKNPETNEIREVSPAALGPWRRKGWILLEDEKKGLNPLANLVTEANASEDDLEGEEQ
jgi:hypothetical protein